MNRKKVPRYLVLSGVYALLIQLSFLAALWLLFEGRVPDSQWEAYRRIALPFTLVSLVAYEVAGLYRGLWRFAGTVTVLQILAGVTLSAAALVVIGMVARLPFSGSLVALAWAGQLLVVGGARFAWQLWRERSGGGGSERATRTLVVGAGARGVHLIQEMRRRPAGMEALAPVGFVDGDPRLTGHLIEGVKVHGTIADLSRILTRHPADLVLVSEATLKAGVMREIARACEQAKVRLRTLPGLSDVDTGRPTLSRIRDIRIEDLLGREPVDLDPREVSEFVRGERVLVTGAGGSIGAELARQTAGLGPAELVLLDHAENGLYYAHDDLAALYPDLTVHTVVGDIRDEAGVEALFRRHRPTLVLHAAAHKHVPLLEHNPREAVFNNIVGTRVLVEAAERHGVGKFVLISTDKAVNPTSVMGASKRACEMILQSRARAGQARASPTRFVAVRFGNVLGSDGSVIPLFRRQLERGGPLTVTHPDARRYFMTVPEAVRLVLQASAMGRGGEVFLLDMGEPVRILDLARQLIRLAGMREGEDVEIVFTGLRAGEKLHEELHSEAEGMRLTRHRQILVCDVGGREEESLLPRIAELERVAREGDPGAVRRELRRVVPEYREKSSGSPESGPDVYPGDAPAGPERPPGR